jgi:hypothetical protein
VIASRKTAQAVLDDDRLLRPVNDFDNRILGHSKSLRLAGDVKR